MYYFRQYYTIANEDNDILEINNMEKKLNINANQIKAILNKYIHNDISFFGIKENIPNNL